MVARANLIGQYFNRLLVVAFTGHDNQGKALWSCRCQCGQMTIVRTYSLRNGRIKSCGCYNKERITKHGHYKTRLYRIWRGMLSRCRPNARSIERILYFNRNITVCSEWQTDFDTFYSWAVVNNYQDHLTIDRIDNDKGYFPDNCRWVTIQLQAKNRRGVKSNAELDAANLKIQQLEAKIKQLESMVHA